MKKNKILLIEDDTFLLSMYSTKFELEGFKVFGFSDSLEGFENAKKEKPDIILLDILMPKMNGFEVLQKLKQDKDTKDIPVVLLTNLNQKDEIVKAREMGAVDYMIKAHFIPSEVVERVKNILNNK